MKNYAVWFLCASVSLLPVAGLAARPATAPAAPPVAAPAPSLPPLTESDSTFSENVSALNAFEITISKMATTEAKRRKVQEFATRSVRLHTTNEAALSALALKHGLTLHKDMSPDEEDVAAQLKTESGAKFERDYLDLQAQAASDALAMFQNEAESASDPELKTYASTTADTLQTLLNDSLKLGAAKPSR
ncbi:DUF4142 domain-containing protein [Komagataeibacter sucrofermentans]|uniref:DUF305 domain-containing protein n=1 Tax=Komagataeibacter sucrofermentans TaxID=1053551 RepID=A0A318QII8_9PROT|nr:DUF4142 domain-containing protein [Komagataeibacter sucrofermentans]PYD79507.1 DUF305 domain-containing protein [Komagataeibacter sucrofermentans]